MSFKEPQPRAVHAAVGVGQKLYIWGGVSLPSPIQTATIDIFDVPSLAWQQPQKLRGSQLPDGMRGMAVATNGENAYFFGGNDSNTVCFNTLFKVDLSTLLCTEIGDKTSSAAPKEKSFSSMLYFDQKLVIHGGCDDKDDTDELHVFDLRTSECACVSQHDYTQHGFRQFGSPMIEKCVCDIYVG